MAYILEIIEWIIVTKTNPKPIQNRLKTNWKIELKWVYIIFTCESQSKNSKSLNIKIMTFILSFNPYARNCMWIIKKIFSWSNTISFGFSVQSDLTFKLLPEIFDIYMFWNDLLMLIHTIPDDLCSGHIFQYFYE